MSSIATIPGNTPEGEFYDTIPLESDQLYQGEIITQVPILSSPKPPRWQLLRTWSGTRIEDVLQGGTTETRVRVLDSNQSLMEWFSGDRGEFVVAQLDKRPCLVLTQNCSLENNKFFQVAPIFSAEGNQPLIEKLKSRLIYTATWLKSHPPQIPDDSYADFELMQSVHKSYFRRILPAHHFRLSPQRIRILQSDVTRYFGRPNSFDSRSDKAPGDGTYLCVSCFYLTALITEQVARKDDVLSVCPRCNGTFWVLKGR